MTTTDLQQHPLAAFLNPRSVVLAAATDRSAWSRSTFGNLKDGGYAEALDALAVWQDGSDGEDSHVD
jgi:hypothetical protein